MKILYCSSEVSPFSKTGGLADVAGSLPKALLAENNDVRVVTPYYSTIKFKKKPELIGSRDLIIIDRTKTAHYYKLDYNGVTHYFIQCDDYFKRENLYGYYDEAERFAFLNYAILEGLELFCFFPDIINANDWQTALLPYFLDEIYRKKSKDYFKIKTLLTIHNLEYQGSFPIEANLLLPHQDDYTYLHFGKLNYLKTGIMRASAINTVSKTYRDEIMTQNYGFGLDGCLRARANQVSGIINGIDYDLYNPETDKNLFANYDEVTFRDGKKENKEKFMTELRFNASANNPLISFIGRLAHQKGIDLMEYALEDIIHNSDALFVLIGSGDKKYEDYFDYLNSKFPDRVRVWIGFSSEIAMKCYASSDFFLMPSKFEPCGLGQLISMRYGTLPIVRETGGLYDTVVPYNVYEQSGTGFSFTNYDGEDFKAAVFRALNVYKDKDTLNTLVSNAMNEDFSMERMALEYIELYKQIKKGY